jgi:hypothetical protein
MVGGPPRTSRSARPRSSDHCQLRANYPACHDEMSPVASPCRQPRRSTARAVSFFGPARTFRDVCFSAAMRRIAEILQLLRHRPRCMTRWRFGVDAFIRLMKLSGVGVIISIAMGKAADAFGAITDVLAAMESKTLRRHPGRTATRLCSGEDNEVSVRRRSGRCRTPSPWRAGQFPAQRTLLPRARKRPPLATMAGPASFA